MGSLQLSNPFAALEHKKAKKKKEKSEREKRKKDKKETLELEKAIFDQPQISVSSWADCDDDEDWGDDPPSQAGEGGEGVKSGAADQEADSDHEIIDLEEEFGVELGKDEEHEADENSGSEAGDDKADLPVPMPKKKIVALAPERQLSKKELKKKEMEELNAVLAELGIDSSIAEAEEGKGSKKKKKKSFKVSGEGSLPEGSEVGDASGIQTRSSSKTPQVETEEKAEGENGADGENEEEGEEGPTNGEIDIETLKAKLARKKSTSKKPSAANLAAAEVKARAKKKGSKKDKTKFNQAPPRN